MIESLLLLSLFAAGAEAPAFAAEPWVALLTGSGGALVSMGLWVRSLLADKREMVEQHKEKDRQLMTITREAIECIQATVSSRESESDFKERLESVLDRIDAKLDGLP